MATTETVRVMNLGPVRITHDHDQRQFFNALLLCAAVGIALFWAYQEGAAQAMYDAIGFWFALVFAMILFAGLVKGLLSARVLSQSLDAIKNARPNAEEIKKLFDVEELSVVDVTLLKGHISDKLFMQIDSVRHLANMATVVGLFGTAWGLWKVLLVFGKITSSEEVFRHLPVMSEGLALAFCTTLVGIVVYVPLNQMHRFLRNSATELKNRIHRMLHEQLSKENGK